MILATPGFSRFNAIFISYKQTLFIAKACDKVIILVAGFHLMFLFFTIFFKRPSKEA